MGLRPFAEYAASKSWGPGSGRTTHAIYEAIAAAVDGEAIAIVVDTHRRAGEVEHIVQHIAESTPGLRFDVGLIRAVPADEARRGGLRGRREWHVTDCDTRIADFWEMLRRRPV